MNKSSPYGERDLSTLWSQKSPTQKVRDDRSMLSEAIGDVCLPLGVEGLLAGDELLCGLCMIRDEEPIALWLVLAT